MQKRLIDIQKDKNMQNISSISCRLGLHYQN